MRLNSIDDSVKKMTQNGCRWVNPDFQTQQLETIGRWIQAGAPSWEVEHDVDFITMDAMLHTIQTHVQSLPRFDRASARYFTMTHLYNAGESPETLRAYQIALSKLVNSLSWGFEIIQPQPIDAAEKLFSILTCGATSGMSEMMLGRRLNRNIPIVLIRCRNASRFV